MHHSIKITSKNCIISIKQIDAHMSKTVSIIIRGKDEEDWLGLCLKSIHEQPLKTSRLFILIIKAQMHQ